MNNNIKTLRSEKGIMQKDLAIKVGVSSPYLHDLENGARGAKPETLEKIAAALDVTVDDLLRKETT